MSENEKAELEELRLFEEFVQENYPQIYDEGWSYVVNKECEDE